MRLNVRCYAGSEGTDQDANQLYLKMLQFVNEFGDKRSTVNTQNGKALIYFVIPASAPFFGLDDELEASTQMIYSEFVISSQVANKIVT